MIIIIKVGTFFLNLIYALIKLMPTQRKVVLLSRQSNVPSVEFQMIQSEIQQKDSSVKVVMLCKTLDGGADSSFLNKFKYFLHIFQQMYHLATAQAAVLDSYCIAVSILKHKKKLTIIQMWHSMGTMKKFGYTALDKAEGSSHEIAYAMRMHQNYDYVFASSEAYKDHLAGGFHCDIRKIVTMPLPRLDLLQSTEYREKIRGRIFRAYPALREKPVVLYCPTFRKEEKEFQKALDRLVESVDRDKYHLVVKLHPLSKAVVTENVMTLDGFSSFDALFVSDYVISDYSCIVYEAAVLDLPLYFYNFDMELYVGGRGLAIDYEKELPGVISKEAVEIMSAIEADDYDRDALKKFSQKYVRPTEHATKDIVDFIFRFLM